MTNVIVPAFNLPPGMAQRHEAKIAEIIHATVGLGGRLPPSLAGKPLRIGKADDTPLARWYNGIMDVMSDGCGWRAYDVAKDLGAPIDEIRDVLALIVDSGQIDVEAGKRWDMFTRIDDIAVENRRLDGSIIGQIKPGRFYYAADLVPQSGRNVHAVAHRLGQMYKRGLVDRVMVNKLSRWFLPGTVDLEK